MIATASGPLARVEKQQKAGQYGGNLRNCHRSSFCQQGAYFVLRLCAADTSVMFISIDGVQILALGWLRNDSGHWYKEQLQRLPSSPKSVSCSHPHVSTPHSGFWRDTFRNGWDSLGVDDLGGECVHGIRHNPRNTHVT